MPASRNGNVQTNKSHGREFITLHLASNGPVARHKGAVTWALLLAGSRSCRYEVICDLED